MKMTILCPALLAVTLLGCDGPEPTPGETEPATSAVSPPVDSASESAPIAPVQDPHSYSNPHAARVTHIELDLTADFERSILKGTATLTVERAVAGADLVLDTRDLDIQDVRVADAAGNYRQAYYELGEADPFLGAPLRVELSDDASPAVVRVRYRTAPGAGGLQWLTPAQTAGKAQPFLFTQSQAIQARTWIPLQDTPAVRFTYAATIRTPAELLAVMSAANEPDTPRDGEYTFAMPQPIPSYLMALAVGDLAFAPLGARTGVYAEPSVVEAAAAEFADTEEMLETTERMFGPYRWGRYDLLILPPSFPFGGMENPRLSFITPTVIAGDRSLVALIAHELAHSWSGNLVTNATWRDLWLNEGFTSYLESRIMEEVYGTRRARMEDTLSYEQLLGELETLPDEAELLAIDLGGADPDTVFTNVPYTKGMLMLDWLEERYGRERFDRFLNEYFDHFAFRSLTTDQFLDYLGRTLLAADNSPVTMEEVREWVFEPGLPATVVVPTSDAFTRVAAQRTAWLDGEIAAQQIETSDWTVHEWLAFLNNLPERLDERQLAELDDAFDLTASRNNEIAHSWLKIAIRNDYEPVYARLESYLVEIGRRKLMRPLYEELVKTEEGARFARRVYERARPGYHPLAQRTIDAIVNAGED